MSELRSETYQNPTNKQVSDLLDMVEYGVFANYEPTLKVVCIVDGEYLVTYKDTLVTEDLAASEVGKQIEIMLNDVEFESKTELDWLSMTVQDDCIESMSEIERESLSHKNSRARNKFIENFVELNTMISRADVFVSRLDLEQPDSKYKHLSVSLIRYAGVEDEVSHRAVIIEGGDDDTLIKSIRLRQVSCSLLAKDVYQAEISDYTTDDDPTFAQIEDVEKFSDIINDLLK